MSKDLAATVLAIVTLSNLGWAIFYKMSENMELAIYYMLGAIFSLLVIQVTVK